MKKATAWEQGAMLTLKNVIDGGYHCELDGNEDAARELETSAYRQSCDIFGDDWWYQHDMKCLESNATAIECWELLLEKIEQSLSEVQ